MSTATAVRKVPAMDHAQHKVFWALSVIDEQALANFFRAIRKGAVRPILVDEVNAELDKGIGFAEMFRSSPAILDITGDTCIEFEVMWFGPEPLRCAIRLGHMDGSGAGALWYVSFHPDGRVQEVEFQEVWDKAVPEEAES